MRSRFVTRSIFGWSACGGVFVGGLALAAADASLARDVGLDLAPPFLSAAVLGFGDFSMERVAMVLGSLVAGVGIDARTTHSPAYSEASPNHAAERPGPPLDTALSSY